MSSHKLYFSEADNRRFKEFRKILGMDADKMAPTWRQDARHYCGVNLARFYAGAIPSHFNPQQLPLMPYDMAIDPAIVAVLRGDTQALARHLTKHPKHIGLTFQLSKAMLEGTGVDYDPIIPDFFNSFTLLTLAARLNDAGCVKVLLEQFNCNATQVDAHLAMPALAQAVLGENIISRRLKGMTAATDTINLLLAHGADMQQRAKNGSHALALAREGFGYRLAVAAKDLPNVYFDPVNSFSALHAQAPVVEQLKNFKPGLAHHYGGTLAWFHNMTAKIVYKKLLKIPLKHYSKVWFSPKSEASMTPKQRDEYIKQKIAAWVQVDKRQYDKLSMSPDAKTDWMWQYYKNGILGWEQRERQLKTELAKLAQYKAHAVAQPQAPSDVAGKTWAQRFESERGKLLQTWIKYQAADQILKEWLPVFFDKYFAQADPEAADTAAQAAAKPLKPEALCEAHKALGDLKKMDKALGLMQAYLPAEKQDAWRAAKALVETKRAQLCKLPEQQARLQVVAELRQDQTKCLQQLGLRPSELKQLSAAALSEAASITSTSAPEEKATASGAARPVLVI